MTDFDATSFVRRIQRAATATEVENAFTAIETLKGKARKSAIDRVEEICVREWMSNAGDNISQVKGIFAEVEAAKGTPKAAFALANLDMMMGGPESGMVMSQAFLSIHKIKREESHPLVKAYAGEAAKLPEAEYRTTLGQLKLVINVDAAVKAQAAEAPKPRRKGHPAP